MLLFYNNFFLFSYPPEEAKIALAESIVKEFPKLRDHEATKGHVRNYQIIYFLIFN